MTALPSSTTAPVVVINPNSVEAVTRGIEVAIVETFPTLPVECLTIAENPAEIITADDIAFSGARVAALVDLRPDAAAFVIACYAQPGTRGRLGPRALSGYWHSGCRHSVRDRARPAFWCDRAL
jgi:hypothetical protein